MTTIKNNAEKPRVRSWLLRYSAMYGFLVLWIHVAGFAAHLSIPKGRTAVVVEAALASPKLTLEVALYILTVMVLNLLPLALLLVSMRVSEDKMRRLGLTGLSYFLIAVLSLWTAILVFNKLYFPNSTFAALLPHVETAWLGWIGGVAAVVYIALGVLPAGWRLVGYALASLKRPIVRAAVGVALAVGIVQPLYSRWAPPQTTAQQPNIIIIGLDSVSPLHLAHHPGALPKLEKLLQESTVFSNTLTPLARTFPAWTSILTAQYPVHSGARFNLTAFGQVETGTTLPKLLKARGYTTIYAQDERKFNNIDESFGFDATVGPTPGVAEFVLAQTADHPLANLVHLTPWAQQLLPFVALNRASAVHYDPDEFVEAIMDKLPIEKDKPLFLAAHFCLAHYPYTWRTQGKIPGKGGAPSLPIQQSHIQALGSLEGQIDQLIRALKQEGRLDNAILVILSDHGESLGYENGAWVSPERYLSRHDPLRVKGYAAFSAVTGATGHGTDVLDGAQYRSLLAFQAFGNMKDKFPAGTRTRMASLVDVSPTLMNALGFDLAGEVDGVNLMDGSNEQRVLPTETGIRFSALQSIEELNEDALFEESKEYYGVEPASARLVLKSERYADLVATKDIALHTDEWMLALLRKNASPVFPRVALLVHKPTGAWTTGNDKELVARAPMSKLRDTALDLYGKEIDDFGHTWAFN